MMTVRIAASWALALASFLLMRGLVLPARPLAAAPDRPLEQIAHRSPVPGRPPADVLSYDGTALDFEQQLVRFANVVSRGSRDVRRFMDSILEDVGDRLMNKNLREVLARVHRVDLFLIPDSGPTVVFVNAGNKHQSQKLVLEYFL